MCYHHHTVFGQVHVRLDGVSPDLDGSTEGTHRVLGILGLVASVRNRLRKAIVDACMGSGPFRCGGNVLCVSLFLPGLVLADNGAEGGYA